VIDPVSAIGMAAAAYRGIKSAIDTGKELHDMAGTLSQWSTAMSDLDFSHKQAQNPPMFKKLFGASQIEQNALEIWGHKQKAKEMREEMKTHISFYYGPSAWDEIVRMEGQMRKKRAAEVYAAEERKQMILEWIVGVSIAAVGGGILAVVFWLIGMGTGKW
tara:strand:- start:653 stop:1135 length:483 start_codon:yes stop_codon:yes gene_type:complete